MNCSNKLSIHKDSYREKEDHEFEHETALSSLFAYSSVLDFQKMFLKQTPFSFHIKRTVQKFVLWELLNRLANCKYENCHFEMIE